MSLDHDNVNNTPAKFNRESPLFVDSTGFPIAFYLHPSIKNESQRKVLRDEIEKNGGAVLDNYKEVDTVLVNTTLPKSWREAYQDALNCIDGRPSKDIYAEPMYFIQHCLKHRTFRHKPKVIKAMGGVRGERTAYTEEDDDLLARYLAKKVPDPEAGGRNGPGLYQTLVEMYDMIPRDFGWVKRHSAQSWHNRYKKNQAYFDGKIAEILTEMGPPSHSQRYTYDRRLSKRERRTRAITILPNSEGSGIEEDSGKGSDEEEYEKYKARKNTGELLRSKTQEASAPRSSLKRKTPAERHSFPAMQSSKKSKLSTRSAHAAPRRRERLTSPAYGALEDEGWSSDADSHGKGHVVDLVDGSDGENSSRPPSPTLVSRSQQFDIDPGPQLSIRHSSPIDISMHSFRNDIAEIAEEPSFDDTVAVGLPIRHGTPPRRRSRDRAVRVQQNVQVTKPRSQNAQLATDAPYRNTRFRSRSADAPVVTRQRRQGKTRQTVSKADELNPVMEHGEDVAFADEAPPKAENRGVIDSDSDGTVMLEEKDVEQLLTAETQISTTKARSATGRTTQTVPNRVSKTLDSDDAQTDNNLHRQPQLQAYTQAGKASASTMDIDPAEVLRDFENLNNSKLPFASVGSQLRSTKQAPVNRKSRPMHSEPAQPVLRSAQRRTMIQSPKTHRTSKIRSGSSSEPFPLHGTRARKAKEHLKQEEMKIPYTPPPGSRASQYTTPA